MTSESTKNSDDPDYRRLWAMSLDELSAIDDDPDNPLYEKAKVVEKEILAPIEKLAQQQRNILADRLRSSMAPAVQTSFKQLLGEGGGFARAKRATPTPESTTAGGTRENGTDVRAVVQQAVESVSAKQPEAARKDHVTAAELRDALGSATAALDGQLELQRAEASKEDEREEGRTRAAKVDRRILVWTLIAAGATFIVTVVGVGIAVSGAITSAT